MIVREGERAWENVHVTHKTQLADLINIDNSSLGGTQLTGLSLLKQAAKDIDALALEAKEKSVKIRALGSAWALSDIAITDGWLLNTKLLNGCFDVYDGYFHNTYPEQDRAYVVVAQCGISIGELNVHLEVTATSGFKRSLKTSGIGAGQTIAGAISGNTHGSAINFGAMSDFVVGLQIVTGNGKSIWLERASDPILNTKFVADLDAELIRDDDIFNSAIVSFGAFGVITAVAIKTSPVYHLKFPKVQDVKYADLKFKLNNFDFDDPSDLYHYEFIFDPYTRKNTAMVAEAPKVEYEPGHITPKPKWIIRTEDGYAPGDATPPILANLPFLSARQKASIQYKQYRKFGILNGVRGTPGQLFTATIFYGEGYTETAIGIPLSAAADMIDVSSRVVRNMKLPAISQVRLVHPSNAVLGFTFRGPKTAVFEFGLIDNSDFPVFEEKLTAAMEAAGIPFTMHWSKNSGITSDLLEKMYGEERIATWKQARKQIFKGDLELMQVFDNKQLNRAGLTG